MTATTVASPWLTTKEAAEYARVSLRTIERWIAGGRLRVARPEPRILRIHVDWLDEAIRDEAGSA